MPQSSIRVTHRKAKGVRLIHLYEGDHVVAIGKCADESESEKELNLEIASNKEIEPETKEIDGPEFEDIKEKDREDILRRLINICLKSECSINY